MQDERYYVRIIVTTEPVWRRVAYGSCSVVRSVMLDAGLTALLRLRRALFVYTRFARVLVCFANG